jgi:Protein of unknown function (DUF1553)/Protein of unknown function (DUF1549)/Planctomycete cytochrome C/Concanavalin A-like lectin/glucanases superfamily
MNRPAPRLSLQALLLGCLALASCKPGKTTHSVGTKDGQDLGKVSFNTHIQPILSENCYHCHGPDSSTREPKKEPLRLDRREFAFQARADGKPVIVKGDPEASLLVRLMKSGDPNEVMPPPESHKKLEADQIALIERWIAQGAEYEDHWAFIPPKRPAVPPTRDPQPATNPVDAFIQEKLAAKGLAPAPPEDPRTLARRAALDLTGLLPDPADVEAFAANPTDAAYDALLEKWFASPAYGEHRARHWLDYARYADTHGLHFDNARAIWPYRDYVIRSFASHKPFDQFVREQLAGDLVPATSAEPWIATGYIRCNVSTNEGGTIPEEIHANNTRDRAEAFGAAFLGLTVGCASCHDHKFDPVSQQDFYSLAAYFNNTAEKPWDENIADSRPVLRLPADDRRKALDEAVAARSQAAAKYEELRRSTAAKPATAFQPAAVPADALELRLRLDEGKGDEVRNAAPGASAPGYKATVNPLVWGESARLWPAARLDIAGELALPDQGDFEADQAFSAASWVRLRMKTGNSTTGDGALISRMGGPAELAHRGWDMYVAGGRLVVHIIHQWPQHAIRVEADGVPRGEWVHLGFTYDGSRSAKGVKLFVNGQARPTKADHDSLQAGQTIRNPHPLHLGRRHPTHDALRESSFQDLRLYRRALADAEFTRLPFEDPAAEILARQPDPRQWSPFERHTVIQGFALAKNPDATRLRDEIATLDRRIEELGKDGTPTLITLERPDPAHAWVLDRGVYTARRTLVIPATPTFLPTHAPGPSRLELAEWLFHPDHPLFARVTVNRAWQELFGTGIVETSDDFGIMGARPSHPELLDWLAVEFRESGWNLKALYKLLLTSRTYRQSHRISPDTLAADPANRLLSRGPRFRMDAEMLRDTALQASGLLVGKIGGAPVKTYQPDGIWEAVSMPESNTLHYKQDQGEALYRRSLYSFWKRFAPPPSLETFDAQARETVCIRRARTNTPLQALVSMNDPQFFEAARKLAERALKASTDDAARLDFLGRTLLSRALSNAETARLKESLAGFRAHYRASPDDAKAVLSHGESPADPAHDPVEAAAWTMVSNQFLNLDETLCK